MKGVTDDGEANFHNAVAHHHAARASFVQLENIEEDAAVNFPSPRFFPEPEAPQEPLEFLARSWSLSAIEAARPSQSQDVSVTPALEASPFVFAPSMTSQMVMDRIMEHSLFAPRRNSHSSGPLIFPNSSGILAASPPLSPKQHPQQVQQQQTEENQAQPQCQSTNNKNSNSRGPIRHRSVGRWFKDMKERKKEALRAHNAQVHAAVSMAGVAAAVAAVAAAATVASSAAAAEEANKTNVAVASAASLVAAQCVELAESMGADHDHVSSVVSSAVNVKTAGDIMTLTAAAATALRGAATLKARTLKDNRSVATVTPYDKLSFSYSSGDLASEDGDAECYTQEILARGCEFLKRSKKGELHWRVVSVHLDAQEAQVILKVQKTKHMGLRKKRKDVVLEVDPDIPAWPGRCLLDNGEQRRYFGVKTASGLLEFECKSDYEHRLWTKGIEHLLSLCSQKQIVVSKQ